MTTPFVLVKSYKSAGIAILLTLLFGPVGLFYASVLAGITMTFLVPILLFLFILLAKFQGNELFEFSIIFALLVAAFYWLICIIWAVIAVNDYNRKIEREYLRQQQILNDTKQHAAFQSQHTSNSVDKSQTMYNSNTNKPNLQEWMKENPGKGINDYFMKFGN